METMGKGYLKEAEGQQPFDVAIKRDIEWLAEDSHPTDLANQELEQGEEPLRAIKEEDPYHTDAEAHAAEGFTPISQTDEYIKTELVLDEEFVDNINDSEAKCKPSLALSDDPLIIAELSDKKNQNIERRKRRPKFCCELCEKKFRTKTGLKYHMRTHTGETIDCEVCGRGFMREESLKRHMLLQHTTEPRPELNCELCEKKFYSTNGLIYHMKKHTGETFGCEVCGARYTQRYTLKTHMLRKHPDIKQQLTLDTQKNAYPQTADDDSEEETFSCEICLRSCKTEITLKRHLETHSKDRERKVACDLCEKKFHIKHSLMNHRKSHTISTDHCKVCGKYFVQKESLKAHMLRHLDFDKTQKVTPQTSKDDAVPISDEEFIDEGNVSESVYHTEETQQPALAVDDEQQTGVATAEDSVTCEVCHNCYPRELLETHMCITHRDQTYKCQFCPRVFSDTTCLKRHITIHEDKHARPSYACVQCGSKYLAKTSLKRHMITEHTENGKPVFDCGLCMKKFYSKLGWEQHKRIHTGETFGCEVCEARYTQRYTLKTHMLRKHPDIKQQLTLDPQKSAYLQTADDDSEEETFSCEICLRSCKTELTLKRHLKTHFKDRERKFACDLCEKKFHAKHSLRYHRESHNTPQTSNDDAIPANTGPISDEEFRHEGNGDSVSHAEGSQRHHMLQKHPVGPWPKFNCELCEKKFFTKNGLKYHMRTHTGESVHCKVCGRSFIREQSLRHHMLQQHPVAPRRKFNCELCEKKFYTKIGLKHHGRKHTGETVLCKVCTRSFTQERSLKLHMLQKHPAAPLPKLSCELCEKKFHSTNGLLFHMKKHTGETFGCEVCEARFTRRQSLKTHMIRKHIPIMEHLTPDPQTNACLQKESLKAHMLRHLDFDKTQKATPQTSNDDALHAKTGLSDEEFRHEGNGRDSVPHAEESQRPALAVDDEQQTGVPIAEDNVTCKVCHNCYPRELIKTHMRITHSDHSYKCKFCPRVFKDKTCLKRHISIHDAKRARPSAKPRREFKCELCEKKFYSTNGLRYHMKKHTGETFDCKVCGARLTQKRTLKAHMLRKHTPETQQLKHDMLHKHTVEPRREFKCELCEKKFHSTNGLRYHRKKHTGETYGCEVCGARFTRHQNLKGHLLRKHTPETQQLTTDPQAANDSVHIKEEFISDEEFLDEEMP